VAEARLEDSGSGLAPAGEGWFVVNVRDAEWLTSESDAARASGAECTFEGGQELWQVGVRLHVLPPGEPNGLYHRENAQEDFLVLAGECVLLVEGEERRLRAWDFFHSPPGTEHIFLGDGSEPCVILMTGARPDPWEVGYPVSQLEAHGRVSAADETSEPRQAYAAAGFAPSRRERPSYWQRLPWA